jgi:HAD superfamily hydrolase (TIGR01509 family)
MSKIKNILFDLGAVIYDIDFNRALNSFEQIGIPNPQNIYGKMNQNPIFDEFDRGECSSHQFIDFIKSFATKPLDAVEVAKAWNNLLIGIPLERITLLEKMKKKHNTFLLSNNNALHYAEIMNYMNLNHHGVDLNALFHDTFYSHLIGSRKPEQKAFDIVIEKTGILPIETIFLDDSPQHLETAKKMGFNCIHITPEVTVFDALRDF